MNYYNIKKKCLHLIVHEKHKKVKQNANQIVALINMLNIIYSAKSSEGFFSSLIKNVDNFVIMVKKKL